MATKTKKPKTKKPSGLSITRDGSKMIFKWKIADSDYGDGQLLECQANKKGLWYALAATAKSTKKSVGEFPQLAYALADTSKFTNIRFRVKGNRKKYTKKKGKKTTTYKPTASDWSYKDHDVSVPSTPSLSAELNSENTNVCTFTWSVADAGDSSWKWFTDLQYQTVLVKDCNTPDGSKVSWNSAASTTGLAASGSRAVTEDSETLAGGFYTRWVRVRSRGPAGNSPWKYAKHVYAMPYKAQIVSVTSKVNASGVSNVKVVWSSQATDARPIDRTVVRYAVAVPTGSDLACPAGASWSEISTIRDTKKNDAVSARIDAAIENDHILYVQVNNHHDSNVAYGTPTVARKGQLAPPSGINVTLNQTSYVARVEATNNSAVNGSFLAVTLVYRKRGAKDIKEKIVGIIPAGDSSVSAKCPSWSSFDLFYFRVHAVVGTATYSEKSGVRTYTLRQSMRSEGVDSEAIAQPPGVSLSAVDENTVAVNLTWNGSDSNAMELSWSDREDAWTSTDEPNTYTIEDVGASRWLISGLESGITWYVRARELVIDGDAKQYGRYSSVKSISLAGAPETPALTLSRGVITAKGSVKVSWAYVSTDGTRQSYAEIAEVTNSGGTTTYTKRASTTADQHVTLYARKMGWTNGSSHNLAVRVTSESGQQSAWSDPVTVNIANAVSAAFSATSLVTESITEDGVTRSVNSLKAMPLTVQVTGAGTGGTTTIVIERAETYHVDRPDETQYNGFEGETVCIMSHLGAGQFTIRKADLLGILDDGAAYRLIATVQDSYGQTATISRNFEVHWTHQALMPEATVEVDQTALVAFITPVAPAGVATGDVCDIYRLSVDRPELIYENAAFGTKYVDPFPTIGEYGGHRIVFKTANGDYITADDELAWLDLDESDGDSVESDANIIEFGSGRVELRYNIDLSNSWRKDFKETQYLGGAVQGDWNPAISRTGTVGAVAVTLDDQDVIQAMRRLATYPGICHVRTKDGSSYPADVQVSENYQSSHGHRLASFSLKITRVDPEELDGMTYEDWIKTQPQEDD